MIKVKNRELTEEAISVINNLIDMDISAKIAFRLMRIIKVISSLIEDKKTLEKKIYDKYTERDENGHPTIVTDNDNNIIENAVKITDMDKFNFELSELLSFENVIEYEQINFDDMNLSTAKIKDLLKIDFLFV
jgi:hypothetical protein